MRKRRRVAQRQYEALAFAKTLIDLWKVALLSGVEPGDVLQVNLEIAAQAFACSSPRCFRRIDFGYADGLFARSFPAAEVNSRDNL